MAIGSIDWKGVGAQRQKELLDAIPKEWKIPAPSSEQYNRVKLALSYLTEGERIIVESSASKALENIKSGVWKSYEVTKAMCHAAAVAHQLVNCLTVIMFDEALQAAKKCDEEFEASGGKGLKALHGLPISLKDCFNVEGHDSHIGFIAYVNKPIKAAEETLLVLKLRQAGSILYCKTNIPMAMSKGESYNNVTGETDNPYNTRLTCGGSSGGEGALIACRGSFLGIGTDIAGSVRIPAAFCGLYSLKPSFGRFPTFGTRTASPGQEGVFSNNGPMARSVDDLYLYSEWLVGTEPWRHDPKVLPIPWRQITLDKKLCFAVVTTDGIHTPTLRSDVDWK